MLGLIDQDSRVKKMTSCSFCKIDSKDRLKSCVCKKVSYCSKVCQAKDWKTHKPTCPPYIIREVPGKGMGVFATRKIKEGQVILQEYPLITYIVGMSLNEFQTNLYPFIDNDTKAKILKFSDPADNFKALDAQTVEMLVRGGRRLRTRRRASPTTFTSPRSTRRGTTR